MENLEKQNMTDKSISCLFHEILEKVPHLSNNSAHFSEYLSQQFCELVGAKTVLIATQDENNASSTIYSIYPLHRKEWAYQPAIFQLIDLSFLCVEIEIWNNSSENKAITHSLNSLDIEKAISIPLIIAEKSIGSILLLDITETSDLKGMLKVFSDLSGVLALIISNSRLYTNLENQVESKTSELQKRNEELAESETKYQNLVENSPDAIAIYSAYKIVYVNKKCLTLMHAKSESDLLGMNVMEFVHPDYHEFVSERMKTVLLKQQFLPLAEEKFFRLDGTVCDVDVKSIPITFEGKQAVQLIVRDITKRKEVEYQTLSNSRRLNVLVDILRYSSDSIQDYLDYALNQALVLTESKLGYIYFYDEEKEEFVLNTWSKEVMSECKIQEKQTVYHLENTGIWGEVVRQRKPIMINDFQAPHPLKKGYPQGHAILNKFLTIPVLKNNKIVAVFGVANKKNDYNNIDIKQLNVFIEIVWSELEKKRVQLSLIESETNLSEAVRIANLCFWEYDVANDIFIFNDQFYKLYHTSVEKEGGYKMLSANYAKKFVFPEDMYVVANEIQKSKQTNNPNNISILDHRIVCADGELRYITVRYRVVKDDFGNNIRFVGVNQDITSRKEAELQIKEKEVQYWNLANSGTALIWTAGIDKLCNYFNETWLKFTGRTLEQELGNGWAEGVHPDDFDKCLATYVTAFDKHEAFSMEYRLRHVSGKYRWILDMGTPNYNSNNEFIGYLGNCIDINERKEVENALVENEEKFRNIFEFSSVGKSLTTLDGKLKVNNAFSNIIGYTEEELNQLNWKEITFSDDIAENERILNSILRGEKESEFWQKRYIHKNGHIVWVDITTTLQRDLKNIPLFFITEITDITERKKAEKALQKSEEKLSKLFGSMNEMVVMHELILDDLSNAIDYRILDCNDSFSIITGIKRESAIGKLATEVYQTAEAPYIREYAKVVITGESYEFDSYYEPMDKHFIISAVSIGKNMFATIATDISAIQNAQIELKEKNQELENYIYVASHDLRSPLVNIQGFSQRLEKQTEKLNAIINDGVSGEITKHEIRKITHDDIPKSLNFIQNNVTKMDTLINGLLQLSRTGRVLLTIKRIDMNMLIKEVLKSLNYQLTECNAQLDIHHLSDCYGDVNLLNQVFSNIIGNSIKYRDSNRRLWLEIASKVEFNRVRYSIKDNGIGINPRQLEKIWDIFYRVDASSSEAGEGLGLSLARRIVEKHKGKIWAESKEGTGSTFYIELQKNIFEV